MPIQAEPDGTLDIENATLRSRGIVALTNMVAGNDVVRSGGPALEVYGDPGPRLELVSNTAATDGTATFTRLESNVGVFSIQSGTDAATNGPITFGGFQNERMRITADGNVGIGITNPSKLLEISGASGLDNSTPVHFRITNTQSATGGSPFTDITKPAGLISYYTTDTSTAGPGDVAGIGFRPESTLGGDTALCFYTNSEIDDAGTPLQERMCITHDGNVGIGTNNPGEALTLFRSGGTLLFQSNDNLERQSAANRDAYFSSRIHKIERIADNDLLYSGGGPTLASTHQIELGYSKNYTLYAPDSSYGPAQHVMRFNMTNPGASTTSVNIMTLSSNGRVGIGTTDPSETLHVNGSAVVSNGMYIHGWRYAANYAGEASSFYHPATITVNPANYYYTLTLEYACRAQAYVAYSDRRIKENIEDVDDASALEILRNLKPKKYTYKDTIKRGTTPVWGFIAQEVRDALPYATNLTVDYIPNIYELANVSQSNVITFTNFNTSNFENNPPTIRLVDKENNFQNVKVTSIIDEHSVSVEDDLSEWCGLYDEATSNVVSGDKIFVYGEEVSDFVSLNKDAIFTIATASVQELDRRIEAEKTKVASLEAQLASVLTRLDALESA